jgi:hypothetical protein
MIRTSDGSATSSSGNHWLLQQRLDLAGEQEALRGLRIIQRLHPQAVAGKKQRPLAGIPHGEGKDAVQPGEHRLAIAGIQAQQYFRV